MIRVLNPTFFVFFIRFQLLLVGFFSSTTTTTTTTMTTRRIVKIWVDFIQNDWLNSNQNQHSLWLNRNNKPIDNEFSVHSIDRNPPPVIVIVWISVSFTSFSLVLPIELVCFSLKKYDDFYLVWVYLVWYNRKRKKNREAAYFFSVPFN